MTFLDSDDEALPGWLSAFGTMLSNPRVAIAFCGIEDVEGAVSRIRLPTRMDAAFGHVVGLFLPGSYAVRRDILMAVGGFSTAMRYGEHHELALRLIPFCKDGRWRTAMVRSPLVRRHRPVDARGRLRSYRSARYESNLHLVAQHEAILRRTPSRRANHLATAGVSAIGLGKTWEGRQLLLRAIRAHPAAIRNYARLLFSFAPRFARHRW